MKFAKVALVAAGLGLLAPAAMAAIRPSAATNLTVQPSTPLVAGARVGAPAKGRQKLTSTGTALAVGGAVAAGVGIAAAAGAFDNGHSSSP